MFGTLLSRARNERSSSGKKTVITVALLPLVALFTFLVAYLIISGFYRRFTPAVVLSIFALSHISVIVVVRWSINLFWRRKKGVHEKVQ